MRGIITLCGPVRFEKQFREVNLRLSFADYAVFMPAAWRHSEEDPKVVDEILSHVKQLDRLYKEKIAISQAIVVINVDGYIGESTKSEIEFAKSVGKPIYWYNDGSWKKLLDIAGAG